MCNSHIFGEIFMGFFFVNEVKINQTKITYYVLVEFFLITKVGIVSTIFL